MRPDPTKQSGPRSQRRLGRTPRREVAAACLRPAISASGESRPVREPWPSRRRARAAPGTSSPRCGQGDVHDRPGRRREDDEHCDPISNDDGSSRDVASTRRHTVSHGRQRLWRRSHRLGHGAAARRRHGSRRGIGVTGRAGSVLSTYTCTKRPSAAASSDSSLEQPHAVDDRGRADLVDHHPEVDGRRVADLGEVAARRSRPPRRSRGRSRDVERRSPRRGGR